MKKEKNTFRHSELVSESPANKGIAGQARNDGRMVKKIVCGFILIFFSFSAYAQNESNMLEKAYKQSSKKELKNFFDAWSREITPITDTELSTYNDTIQQAYKLFIDFYNSYRLDSNDEYKNVDFLILQNTLEIYFTDKVCYTKEEKKEYLINEYNKRYKDNDSIRQVRISWLNEDEWIERVFHGYDTIHKNKKQVDLVANFRPQINCENKIPIYLMPKYDTLLNAFLGSEHLEFGTGGIMSVAQAKGESKKRQNFLENYIKIFHGHWGGYWHLCSFPKAYSITFDKDMEYAMIDFRSSWASGGEVIFKKEGDTWIFVCRVSSWIE